MMYRDVNRILATAFAATVIALWPQQSAIAQQNNIADIEALRSAAMFEIADAEEHVNNDAAEQSEALGSRQYAGRLNFFAMQICLLAVVLVLHTYTGMHIIRRGIIFCDLVLDQLAALGIVAGITMGIKYGTTLSYLMAMSATIVGCILLAVIKPGNKLIPHEAIIGIMYGMALIASLLLADKMPTGGGDLKNTLVGSMSWVSWPLVAVTASVYIVLLLFHYKYRCTIIKFTESNISVAGRALWDFLFFLSQGIITILIVPVAGVLLAYGFLMIPAAIGTMFTSKWKSGLLLGWTSGMTACLIGLFFSYKTDSPYGPSLVLSMGLFFLIALLLRTLLSTSKGYSS